MLWGNPQTTYVHYKSNIKEKNIHVRMSVFKPSHLLNSLLFFFTYRKARKQGFSSYGSHANSISTTRCICFLGLLNTLPECLIQWQSFSPSAGCQKSTMKLPAGPHILGRLRKDLFLPLPHFWCSQQCLVSLSLQTHHSECCLGHQHSVLLCLSGSVSCIYFSYKDSNHIEFRPQPKPAQSYLH